MKKLTTGIIGYGVVGRRRKIFIDKNKFFEVKYISDIRFKNNYVKNGIKYFKFYDELLKENLDAVFVTLPNYLAAKVTQNCLRKKIHVFCEKPPGRNVSDITRVRIEEKKHKGVKLMYGFNHRYHSSVITAKKILDSKKYGKVINFRCVYGKSKIVSFKKSDWRSKRKYAGGGILLDQGIHMVDLLRYFHGEFKYYKSFISNNFWNYDIEDNAFTLMKDDKGVIASLHSTATQWEHRFRFEITLEKALLELSGILSGTKSYGKEILSIIKRKKNSDNGTKEKKVFSFSKDDSWQKEIDRFSKVITNDEKVLNGNSLEALNIMKMLENIYSSDKTWVEKIKNKFKSKI